jgi:hypothetical protein
MKKNLFRISIVTFILSVFGLTWSFLMPEKRIALNSEVKSPDSSETEIYKSNVLNEYNKKIDEKVAKELSDIHTSSQANLLMISEAVSNHGCYSEEVKKLSEIKNAQDEINKQKVCEIIDKYGWLGAERIGAQNNYTLFAVLQNADFETQEKYMPLMEQAVKTGSLSGEYYANMVDRKAIVQHQKQIYGTLLTGNMTTGKLKFAPIIDEELVNERRREIGLPSIEFYAKKNNVDYIFAKSNS